MRERIVSTVVASIREVAVHARRIFDRIAVGIELLISLVVVAKTEGNKFL